MKRLSLHQKIMCLFLVSGMILGITAWILSAPLRHQERGFPRVAAKNLKSHLEHQIEKMGEPPSKEIAQSITQDLELDIAVQKDGQFLWSTGVNVKNWNDLENEVDHRMLGVKVGKYQDRLFALMERGSVQYVFFLPERDSLGFSLRMFGGFLFFVFFVLFGVFALTRWLLRPMHPLMAGVNALKTGNLSYRMKLKGNNEFRVFAEAFNDMATALENQMRSKDKLIMDVSHELRSPLGRLKLASEMLPESTQRKQIKEDLFTMEDLVTEILESYRLRSGQAQLHKTSVDLKEFIVSLSERYNQQKPGLTLDLKDNVQADLDVRLFQKVITNILDNAFKFSSHQNRPVEIKLSENCFKAQIEIKDYGIGIEQKHLNLIFEPFYRADSSRVRDTGGFGLGLGLAKEIIEAHGGSLRCESKPGQGTTFKITF